MSFIVESGRFSRSPGFSGLGGVSAPAGLGWAQVALCDKFAQALDLLQTIITRADEEGSSGPALTTARQRLENETSLNPFNRTLVSGAWNCDARTAELGALLKSANAELKTPFIIPNSISDATDPKPMDPVAKFAIVGGIAVVGIIGVAYITGQLSPLLRLIKK